MEVEYQETTIPTIFGSKPFMPVEKRVFIVYLSPYENRFFGKHKTSLQSILEHFEFEVSVLSDPGFIESQIWKNLTASAINIIDITTEPRWYYRIEEIIKKFLSGEINEKETILKQIITELKDSIKIPNLNALFEGALGLARQSISSILAVHSSVWLI